MNRCRQQCMTSLYSKEVILFILWFGKQHRGNLQQIFWKSVFPRTVHEIGLTRRLDIVWDRYNPISIGESTRDKRGHSCRQRVTGFAKVLRDWQTFLKNADNKKKSFLHICPACYRQDNCLTEKSCTSQKKIHISPSFTCPPNKVNRTSSHWRYWHCRRLTSKSPTNHIGKPSSWHLDLLQCRQIQKNNTIEQYCRKSLRRDLQISGTVLYANGLRQHICFQIYRKTFLLDYTYKMQPISIHSGIRKKSQMLYIVYPQVFVRLMPITCANCTEVKLISTMLII